eukprot:4673432-Alexandrium_andersonii.AAC.1
MNSRMYWMRSATFIPSVAAISSLSHEDNGNVRLAGRDVVDLAAAHGDDHNRSRSSATRRRWPNR